MMEEDKDTPFMKVANNFKDSSMGLDGPYNHQKSQAVPPKMPVFSCVSNAKGLVLQIDLE